MANYTPNLNLKKPTGNEYYDVVAEDNDAKDKIDAEVGLQRAVLANIPNQTYITEKAKTIDVNNAMTLKADKTTTDNLQSQITNTASGSPKATYATLSALQSAYPGGTSGIFVVTADGKWYYWSGSAWTVGGTYQSTGIADNSITPVKTDFMKIGKNLFNKAIARVGFYINQDTGLFVANASHNASDYIEITPSTAYIGSPTIQRYVWYDVNKTYISGGLGSQGVAITSPVNAKYLAVSNEGMDINTMQVEQGIAQTAYTPYGYRLKDEYLLDSKQIFNGDGKKQYRMIGGNIRTPLEVGGAFSILDDAGHEPMGIYEVAVYDGDLRITMPFTATKVITMSVSPHVSLMQEGYQVACTGGTQVHAVAFFKNGVKVPAQDVVINGGSLWFSGTFLI